MHFFWHESLLLENSEVCLLKKQLDTIIMDLSKFPGFFSQIYFLVSSLDIIRNVSNNMLRVG